MCRECRERFPRHRSLAIPTCLTARAWRTCRDACRDRWPAVSFEVGGGENVPSIPGACATRNFVYLVRGLLWVKCVVHVLLVPLLCNDDVIKWKHFPRYWSFVRGIHRPPVNSPHKGQWRGALLFSMICVWINGWVNNREAGDLRRHNTHYDAVVMVEWTILL